MISADDLVDVVWENLKPRRDKACIAPKAVAGDSAVRAGRLFLSEHEIKKMITKDKILRVPADAILSPLAQDWLFLDGIQVVREGAMRWR